MKHLRNCLFLFILALTLISCSSPAAPAPTKVVTETITISGSGSTSTVLGLLVDMYNESHTDLNFEILPSSGSGTGAKQVAAGEVTLAAMARAATESELAAGMHYYGFALDPTVIVVSPDLPITNLSSDQVKAIFAGDITNFAAVGGPDTPINVFIRDEEESAIIILRQTLFGDLTFSPNAILVNKTSNMEDVMLVPDGNAIGILNYAGTALRYPDVKTIAIDNNDPTAGDGSYPHNHPIGIGYLPENKALIQPFLDFLASPEVKMWLQANGITPDNTQLSAGD